jgi:DNA-binding response OmpR family regulator
VWFLRRWWSGLGIEVVDVVGDGRQAVDVARRTSPDAVLWDLGRPSGEEFGLVRSLKVEAQVPLVIVWSAYSSALCCE